ncbi:PREDICTED: dynamin-related protein 4C-like [Nicotiana attenuata]|uniref:Dynamin-related protein 4c n=1 Tax=Nicotiana attenuata TaxID=49451 RepID=A0A1J6KEI2_NICAT|nr:PREDICTED: dynamin-related protein 4C-like [Nicotiana attenuata]OIT21227.1 dynamin-related protein 4c [Nicotiana attenuata]
MQQCIQPLPVPIIVLVGDRCSGKSSLIASLIGIKIPLKGHFCIRVPILIKLQNHHSRKLEVSLEFDGETRTLRSSIDDDDEWYVALEISQATNTIAGTTNGISNNPLTLILKKIGFPNLTIVDLPGIPTLDEANKEIYERVHQMILNYITSEDRIILNVLSASTDSLPKTFESMNISKKVGKKCERTLVVVTNADNAPHKFLNELVLGKVTAMGFNYVCVRNNIDLESFKESEIIEATLFETHEFLSKIKKSMVSIPVLARKLMIIQVKITSTDIQRKIKDRLNANVTELKKLPTKKSQQTILPGGNQFDDNNEDCTMYKKSLQTMLDQYSVQLHSRNLEKKEDFLIEEIMYIKDIMVNGLSIDFLNFLHEKVDGISKMTEEFVCKMWNCVERVIIDVLMHHFDSHPQLQDSTRRAVQNLIPNKKDESINWVREIIGMEKLAIGYTCINPCYVDSCNRLLAQETTFMDIMNKNHSIINIEGIGEVDVEHLRNHLDVARLAFDLKMKTTAHWKIFSTRQVDFMALHAISAVRKMAINNEMEEYIANYLTTSNEIEEAPEISKKWQRLEEGVKLLESSKDEVVKIGRKITGETLYLLGATIRTGGFSSESSPFVYSFVSWCMSLY